MSFDATINSSDVELSPTPVTRFSNVDQKSIDKILDNALKDRISSKKEVKELAFTLGRPSTQYQHALWMRRLQTYRSETLGVHLKSPTTCHEIEQFLTSIIDKVIPKSEHGVPSLSWMNSGILRLTKSSLIHYSHFHLSDHDKLRIKTLVDGFLKQGKLTNKPARENHWVGVSLVKIMADAILDNALEHGTRNWDVTVQHLLMLILLSSLQCRAGDITKWFKDDQPLPFLAYQDVRLKLVGGSSIQDLEARVTIRNEKRYK